jgi:hypothetical protein
VTKVSLASPTAPVEKGVREAREGCGESNELPLPGLVSESLVADAAATAAGGNDGKNHDHYRNGG